MRLRSVISQSVALGLMTTVADIYWNGALTYFYLQNLGLDAGYAAAAWIIFSIWNALDNLVVGVIQDRSTSRRGRRTPFIRVCGPLMGLMFCVSFLAPSFALSQGMLALYFLLSLSLLDFCVGALEVSLYSLPYEETLDKTERGKVFVLQAAFSLMTVVMSTLIIPEIQPEPGENITFYRGFMCVLGIISGFAIFVSSFFIDNRYRQDAKLVRASSLFCYISDSFRNKAFLVAELYGVTTMAAYTIFIFGFYFYLYEVATVSWPCYAGAAIGVLSGFWIYFAFIKKVSVKDLAFSSSIASGILMLAGFFLGRHAVGGALACVGAGVQYVGHMMYYSQLFGEAVDAGEARSGFRKEGVYNGLDCVFVSVTNGLQPLFLIIILAFGYVEHMPSGVQSELAKQGILVGWLIPPTVFILAGALCVKFLYPLNKRKLGEIHETIEKNRKEI